MGVIMYDKAISLKVSKKLDGLFSDKELKVVGKLHIAENLINQGYEIDNDTQFMCSLDKTKDDHLLINVRAFRGCEE